MWGGRKSDIMDFYINHEQKLLYISKQVEVFSKQYETDVEEYGKMRVTLLAKLHRGKRIL